MYRRIALVKAVRMQVERTIALAHYFPMSRDGLKTPTWKGIKYVPLFVTLSNTSLRIFEGTPVVPIFSLNSFWVRFKHI